MIGRLHFMPEYGEAGGGKPSALVVRSANSVVVSVELWYRGLGDESDAEGSR